MKRYVGHRVPMTTDDWRALGWDEEEARRLASEHHTAPRVIVVNGDHTIGVLRHHVRHSPSGFEWGYHGSGPADLARCILIDYFDMHEAVEEEPDRSLGVSYQDFKREKIAPLPADTAWVITEHEIEDWLGVRNA